MSDELKPTMTTEDVEQVSWNIGLASLIFLQ